MENNYELTECPNCKILLELERFCQNCKQEILTLEEYNILYNDQCSLDKIKQQSIEIHGCNCKDCWVYTPLFEERTQNRIDRIQRNLQRVERFNTDKKIQECLSFLKSQHYKIDDIVVGCEHGWENKMYCYECSQKTIKDKEW